MKLFQKAWVAWGLTLLMVVAAIGIGRAKAPANAPDPGLVQGPGGMPSYVRDDASVLSNEEVEVLRSRNLRLYQRHGVAVGVVTCNYGRDDLYEYTVKKFRELGLSGHDMLLVLDIRGDNYRLYTGDDVAWYFSDEDCNSYLDDYLEYYFARGLYGDGALYLTEALEIWYGNHYN